MSSTAPVPADIAPASLRELAEDCRQLRLALPVSVPRPGTRPARPVVDIGARTVAALEGLGAYGS